MRNCRTALILLAVLILLSAVLVAGCGRRAARANPPAGTSPQQASSPTALDPVLGLHAISSTGHKTFYVIMADFKDVKRQYPVKETEERVMGFVLPYLEATSFNKLHIEAIKKGPYLLPKPVGNYKIASSNLDVDPVKVTALVRDVADAADNDIKFTEDVCLIICLGATHEEYGMVGLCPVPGMLGWQTASVQNKSGETIANAAVFCENAHLGTYIHDSLHMLGGRINNQRMTPCLYDHELQQKYPTADDFAKCLINMGFWDPLSSHTPYDRTLPPTGLSAWTRLRLGWIDADKIALVNPREGKTVRLDPLVAAESSTLVIKIPVSPTTFYLVENRQKIASDQNLPSWGALITYADDTVMECRNGKAPVRIMDANPSVPYFNDAAFEIGKKDTFIDKKNGIAIKLLKKVDYSYDVLVTTPDKVK
jgi:M6 family metalloprotease-like protein